MCRGQPAEPGGVAVEVASKHPAQDGCQEPLDAARRHVQLEANQAPVRSEFVDAAGAVGGGPFGGSPPHGETGSDACYFTEVAVRTAGDSQDLVGHGADLDVSGWADRHRTNPGAPSGVLGVVGQHAPYRCGRAVDGHLRAHADLAHGLPPELVDVGLVPIVEPESDDPTVHDGQEVDGAVVEASAIGSLARHPAVDRGVVVATHYLEHLEARRGLDAAEERQDGVGATMLACVVVVARVM